MRYPSVNLKSFYSIINPRYVDFCLIYSLIKPSSNIRIQPHTFASCPFEVNIFRLKPARQSYLDFKKANPSLCPETPKGLCRQRKVLRQDLKTSQFVGEDSGEAFVA